ncbi:MAG TPA: cytochrome c family protein, partial [Novosphingobium sp.]|nr:cytochrome c family protein [Novosphingobium sp.]
RSRWLAAAVCTGGWVGLFWGLSFFFDSLMTASYPARLAAEPVGNMPPPVDMAAVQRNWPDSLTRPQERVRLSAYLHQLERETPLQAITPRAPVPPVALDLGTLLSKADPHAGERKARVCMSCHDFTQGGPNRIGPDLWGVVGRDIASRPGFSYSSAMSAQPGAWSYQRLFDYLESPARAVPGNKMGFAGLRNPEDRAAVVRYLATLGPSPPPLPQPQSPK